MKKKHIGDPYWFQSHFVVHRLLNKIFLSKGILNTSTKFVITDGLRWCEGCGAT